MEGDILKIETAAALSGMHVMGREAVNKHQ